LNQQGACISPKELKSLFNLISNVGDNADYLVLSGSLPPNVEVSTYYKVMQLVRKHSDTVKLVLDADGEALRHGLKACPFLVKPNVHELERLLSSKLANEKEIMKALQQVKKMGAQNVIVSRGAKGAIALDEAGVFYTITGPNVPVMSTVGAGDAFVAGFIQGLDTGKSFIDSLRQAAAVSTAMVMTPGTQLCHLRDIKNILKQIKVTVR
jgi:1-phosphofructokinase family hexose kinase